MLHSLVRVKSLFGVGAKAWLTCLLIVFSTVACQRPEPVLEVASEPEANGSFDLAVEQEESVRFGVLAIDSAVSVSERYGLLMAYLSEEVGRPFELVAVSQESQFSEVQAKKLDFITNNPLAAVQVQRLHQTQFLATHTRPKTGPEFSGLIVVSQDSDIESISDLEGKRAACVAFQTAAAGCTFQIYHLMKNGFDPYINFSTFVENKSQDSIVLSILNGTIDVGFIRTGQLEKMAEKGLISAVDELKVVDPAEDSFFYEHTTALYPEWPVAALAETDSALVELVQSALLNMPDSHPALAALKVDGFLPAVDYTKVSELIEALQLRSWDAESQSSED